VFVDTVFHTYRVKQAEQEGSSVVDVDGSYMYLYRKYKALIDSGKSVVLPTHPSPPMTGWLLITEENYRTVGLSVPSVTTGNQSCAIFVLVLLTSCCHRFGVYLPSGSCGTRGRTGCI